MIMMVLEYVIEQQPMPLSAANASAIVVLSEWHI
jgi:hypothetical protein